MADFTQLARHGLFDARVPRYTSYPTAPQFSGGVDPARFAEWIAAIPEGAAISLYLHVPFCRRLCWFCACRTQGTSSDAPVVAYVKTLQAELAILAQHLPRGVRLSRLHWGGGTPTLLAPGLIGDLAGAVLDVAPMAEGGEFSVEIDPSEVDEARLDALVAAGMNRASIGVQDFDPEIQRAIGREQGFELTRDVVGMIRSRKVASLNADILFGLPHQTGPRIANSVQKLLSFSPDRVALYGYAHVPWMSRRQQMIPSDAMPTPQERLELFEVARELFLADGYQEIGIDHFARPQDALAVAARDERLRRNFQGYTDDTAPVLIGIGASSISRFPQGYAQNAAGTADHVAAIRAGRFSTHRGHAFAGQDRLRGRIIEALMCDFAVERAELAEFGVPMAEVDAMLAAVAAAFEGAVRLDKEGLTILPEARPLTRVIARGFDGYDQSKAQHSAAI
jgi:oxygen-independent coproporphyrinogen III oxidase